MNYIHNTYLVKSGKRTILLASVWSTKETRKRKTKTKLAIGFPRIPEIQ